MLRNVQEESIKLALKIEFAKKQYNNQIITDYEKLYVL